MTPEETKWRASVYAPEKLRRKLKLQYWLLGAWSLLAGAWVVSLCTGTDTFGWTAAVALFAGYANDTARHRQPQAAPGREKAVLELVNGKRQKERKKTGNLKKTGS